MAVIVRTEEELAGMKRQLKKYLPDGITITEEVIDQARKLDEELSTKVDLINQEYKANPINKVDEKWAWLGSRVDSLLNDLEYLNREDVHNNSIWPAISQYLVKELRRDTDKKRYGTSKDHLRKCWVFSKGPVRWIPNWAAWDAIADRGDQLTSNPILLELMEEAFGPYKKSLSSNDYKRIGKLLAEKLPSQSKSSANVGLMEVGVLKKIVSDIVFIILQKND